MTKVGGLTTKYYKETGGVKVSGGQTVTAGTLLTRQGDKWKPGINVIGAASLTAGVSGEIYFTKKKNKYKKIVTVINVKETEASKN
ncbi:MAG: ribosomal protein L27 [Lysobacterales bacterium]|jgi:ribosomal protein L27